jgi:ribosomal protein L31E
VAQKKAEQWVALLRKFIRRKFASVFKLPVAQDVNGLQFASRALG